MMVRIWDWKTGRMDFFFPSLSLERIMCLEKYINSLHVRDVPMLASQIKFERQMVLWNSSQNIMVKLYWWSLDSAQTFQYSVLSVEGKMWFILQISTWHLKSVKNLLIDLMSVPVSILFSSYYTILFSLFLDIPMEAAILSLTALLSSFAVIFPFSD